MKRFVSLSAVFFLLLIFAAGAAGCGARDNAYDGTAPKGAAPRSAQVDELEREARVYGYKGLSNSGAYETRRGGGSAPKKHRAKKQTAERQSGYSRRIPDKSARYNKGSAEPQGNGDDTERHSGGIGYDGLVVGAPLAALAAIDTDKADDVKAPRSDGVPLPIIMYHSILKSRSGKFIVSPDILERDMLFLQKHGYTTVFTQEVIDYVKGKGELPDKPIIVTFDDGYFNNLHYALPIFERLGLKGVINVVGHYADKAIAENDTNPNYSHLTWEQTRQLKDSGRFEIGNHTYDMHRQRGRLGVTKLRGECSEDYRKALEADIGRLQKNLTEKSGVTPNVFAYPFGKYCKDTPQILKDMGFEAIFTCNEGINNIRRGDYDTLLALKRYNRPGGKSTERFFSKLGIRSEE